LSTPARPDAILFDAGGTLVLISPDRFNEFLGGFGLPPVDAERLAGAHYQAMGDYADRLAAGGSRLFSWWVERFFGLAGVAASEEMVNRFEGGRGMWNYLIPGARETVETLAERGYRVGVVSNSDGTVADNLELAGFGGLFEVVVDSGTVGVSKPDPAIFTVALEALDLTAGQAWYVGDSHYHDVGGARAAGLSEVVLIDPLGLGPAGQVAVRSITEVLGLLL